MADILNIGISGLNASKKSLKTTGHNLANVNTEGYSRQRSIQTTSPPVIKQGFLMGTGVRSLGVRRFHSEQLEKRLNNAHTEHEFFNERYLGLRQVEDIFNEMGSDGLEGFFNNFFNAFRELGNQPENETFRSLVRDSGEVVVRDFQRIRRSLNHIVKGIDAKIEQVIRVVNEKARHIADLNTRIKATEISNDESSDLRDQRDMVVKDLSKYFKLETYSDERNNFNINIHGVGTIVTGGTYVPLATGAKSREESSNDTSGSIEIFFKKRSSIPITDKFQNGMLSAMVKNRNDNLLKMQRSIDRLCYDFVKSVNAIHRRGYVNRKIDIDENGNHTAFDSTGPLTGINFFKEPGEIYNASSLIEISDEVKENLSNISTALKPNAPGDNRVALGISKLQHEKIFNDNTTSISELYLQSVADIGIDAGKAKLNADQTAGIVAQLDSLKQNVSGVSMDEEASNMVKFQQAYDASAKVIKVADQMFQTVLGTFNR